MVEKVDTYDVTYLVDRIIAILSEDDTKEKLLLCEMHEMLVANTALQEHERVHQYHGKTYTREHIRPT